MAVVLSKGENINLTKDAPGLKTIIVGLGWDPAASGDTFDLDAMAFMLKADGKVRSDKDFVYYGNLKSVDGSVESAGDDLTGGNSEKGDDEQITVKLDQVPADVESIKFLVDIYEAAQKHQSFGQVKNAYVRLVNADTQEEVVRYDLTEDYSGKTDVMVAELYRHDGSWKFKAIGEGSTLGSKQIADDLGVNA